MKAVKVTMKYSDGLMGHLEIICRKEYVGSDNKTYQGFDSEILSLELVEVEDKKIVVDMPKPAPKFVLA